MFRIALAALALAAPAVAAAADLSDGQSFNDGATPLSLAYLGSGRPDLTNRVNRDYIVIVAGTPLGPAGFNANRLFNRQQLNGPLTFPQAYSLSFTRTWIDDSGYSLRAPSGFGATPPVPEPGEWAMIAAGLGVVGFTAARRRRA